MHLLFGWPDLSIIVLSTHQKVVLSHLKPKYLILCEARADCTALSCM